MRANGPSNQGKVFRATRLALPKPGLFRQKYLAATSLSQRLQLLKDHYPIPGVEIKASSLPGLLGIKGIGRCIKNSEKDYEIQLMGVTNDKEAEAYILFHEYMHVWLDKNQLTFGWEGYSEEISQLLFDLKNCIDDYLIEKETRRQFGDHFAWLVGNLRDYDLKGQFSGLGTQNYVTIYLLAITCKMVTQLYPSLSKSISNQLIGIGIKLLNLETILSLFKKLSIEDPFHYRELVAQICEKITGTNIFFSNGNIQIGNLQQLNEFINHTNEQFEQIMTFLQMALKNR